MSVAAESQASFLCRNEGAGHAHDHSFCTPALLRARDEDAKGSDHTSAANPWQLGEKCSGEKECFPPKAWFGGAVLETNRCQPKHCRPLLGIRKPPLNRMARSAAKAPSGRFWGSRIVYGIDHIDLFNIRDKRLVWGRRISGLIINPDSLW